MSIFKSIVKGSTVSITHRDGSSFTLTATQKYTDRKILRFTYVERNGKTNKIGYSLKELTTFSEKGYWVKVDITHPHTVELPEELFEV